MRAIRAQRADLPRAETITQVALTAMIIGITGYAGSGKDTIADILVRDHGFGKVAFADPLKRICKEVFDFSDEQLWGSSSKRDEPDLRYPRFEGNLGTPAQALAQWPHYLTPRYALQQLGSEWGRHCHKDVWVNYAMRIADALLSRSKQPDPSPGVALAPSAAIIGYDPRVGILTGFRGVYRGVTGIVIPDVRFPNEVAALRRRKAVIWRATHGDRQRGGAGASLHESERHIDAITPDVYVGGDGPLEELPAVVAALLAGAQDDAERRLGREAPVRPPASASTRSAEAMLEALKHAIRDAKTHDFDAPSCVRLLELAKGL